MKIYFFGRKSIASAIVVAIIGILIFNFGVSEEYIMKLYSEIQRLWGNKLPPVPEDIDDILREKMRTNPELLDYNVRRGVDMALAAYRRQERENTVINMKNKDILNIIENPKYSDTQRQIIKDAVYYEFADGTMGIRGIWVSPDPREIQIKK